MSASTHSFMCLTAMMTAAIHAIQANLHDEFLTLFFSGEAPPPLIIVSTSAHFAGCLCAYRYEAAMAAAPAGVDLVSNAFLAPQRKRWFFP